MVGPTTKELESVNELIKFDHVYFKPDQTSIENCIDLEKIKPTVEEPVFTLKDIENLEKLFDAELNPSLMEDVPTDLSMKKEEKTVSYENGFYSDKSYSDSGFSEASSPYQSAGSPVSTSSLLDDAVWEESFSELFPNLI